VNGPDSGAAGRERRATGSEQPTTQRRTSRV
jgi:hypothetical protein